MLRPNFDAGRDSRCDEFHRVAQQIGNALGQHRRNGDARREIHPSIQSLRGGRLEHRVGFDDVAQQLDPAPPVAAAGRCAPRGCRSARPGSSPSMRAAALLMRRIYSLPVGAHLLAAILDEDFGKTLHGPQRRAHVVRNAVGKRLQFADGFPQRGGAVLRPSAPAWWHAPCNSFCALCKRFLRAFAFRDVRANGDVLLRFAVLAQVRNDGGVHPVESAVLRPVLDLALPDPAGADGLPDGRG